MALDAAVCAERAAVLEARRARKARQKQEARAAGGGDGRGGGRVAVPRRVLEALERAPLSAVSREIAPRADAGRPPGAQAQGTPPPAEEATPKKVVDEAAAKKAKEGAVTLLAADKARIEEERAQPPPEGSEWDEYGGTELEELLAFTDIINAAWLLKLADGEVMPELNGVVPPWQEVPDEAKLAVS